MYKAKKLINDPHAVVTEFIEGLVETYSGLQYLDGFPQIKVVLRADVVGQTYDKVAVISGGGSGHEPAHAGFVGEGMLTATICGDVFTSPPVDAILAGIRAVTGPMGCLLIVTNYTGDRLNFGLAAEQAKSEGYKVETVIVGDDCALHPPRGIAGRRGLAGTVLVNKVAGAAAAAGLSLAEVAAEAKHASEMVGTMGVALSVCTIPGEIPSDRLGPQLMELGLGIHGKPGADIVEIQPVEAVVSHVLKQILSTDNKFPSKYVQYPLVDFRSSGDPAQSTSEKHVRESRKLLIITPEVIMEPNQIPMIRICWIRSRFNTACLDSFLRHFADYFI